MAKCIGRLCGDKVPLPPGSKAKFSFTEKQCAKACQEGSNLCKICTKHEEANMAGENIAKSGWHGRMGEPLRDNSHIMGSKWNLDMRAFIAAKAATGTKKAVADTKKAERATVVAVKAASVAEKKHAAEMKKAEKAKRRVTRKKSSSNSNSNSSNSNSSNSNSSSGSSGNRRSLRIRAPTFSRRASSASMRPTYSERWSLTPQTPFKGKQNANLEKLNAIGTSLLKPGPLE